MVVTTSAIRFHEVGGPEVLVLEDVSVAAPGPDEARVRHTAVGVNFIDTYHRSGLYPVPALPSGIGVEAAGVVEAVGAEVKGLEVGARVAYASAGPPGAYAGLRIVPAERLVSVPDGIDDRVAAASLLQGMTAEYLVQRCVKPNAGDTVLVHAAAGGVGLLLCQWLAHLGVSVIGTVGTEEKAARARAHGCEHVVVYTKEDFEKRVDALTDGAGVSIAYDSVGKATLPGSLRCLRPRGTLVSFGNASGAPDPISPLELGQRGSLTLTRPSLKDYTATREELVQSAADVFRLVDEGVLKVIAEHQLPLAQAKEAHRALEARETSGSIVLIPEDA